MPLLRISAPLRPYAANQAELRLPGATVAAVIMELLVRYPAMRPFIYDTRGQLHRFVNIFVNDQEIRGLAGLDTPLAEKDSLLILPGISGGS